MTTKPDDKCICGEINARHCPVHSNDKPARTYYVVCDDPEKPIGVYCPPKKADDGVLAHDLFIEHSAYQALQAELESVRNHNLNMRMEVGDLRSLATEIFNHCACPISKELHQRANELLNVEGESET